MKLSWLGLVLLSTAGCAVHLIPGTEISDTPEDRAILALMEKYRTAVQAKDVEALSKLVSTSFRDDAGTTNPEDDLDYASLRPKLSARWAKITDLTLELSVRKIKIDRNVASAVYYYNEHFRVPKLTSKIESEGDIKEMWFKREDNTWKIVSGI
jgi:ketosteroid isomerase-like protein